MIYVTGDTHGEKSRFFGEHTDDKEFTKDDCLIICGDFGFIFEGGAEEKTVLDELEKKPYTIAFCDGNHENFPCLYSYPEEEWNGGQGAPYQKEYLSSDARSGF